MDGTNGVTNGTAFNALLDRLGVDEGYGDLLASMIDSKAGDVQGTIKNLFDLLSGMDTAELNQILSQLARPEACKGYMPSPSEQVAREIQVGHEFTYRKGGKKVKGRITGRQYEASFGKAIKLENGKILYHGRLYPSLDAVVKDALDGNIDGFKSLSREVTNTDRGLIDDGRASTGAPIESRLLEMISKYLSSTQGKLEEYEKEFESTPSEDPKKSLLLTKIQTLMSARQEMVALVSGIMNKLNASNMEIIRNMRA